MQASRASGGQSLQIALGGAYTRQDVIGQRQDTQSGGGQAGRAGAAVQQLHLKSHFQVAELVREGGLRNMQALGGFLQAAAVADGAQGSRWRISSMLRKTHD